MPWRRVIQPQREWASACDHEVAIAWRDIDMTWFDDVTGACFGAGMAGGAGEMVCESRRKPRWHMLGDEDR
jgi:hypothetical protein